MEERDHYLEQTELPSPQSPPPVPIPSPSAMMSSPSTLLSLLSSPPPSTGTSSPIAVESESEYRGVDKEILALNRSFLQSLPNGTQILSAPTWVVHVPIKMLAENGMGRTYPALFSGVLGGSVSSGVVVLYHVYFLLGLLFVPIQLNST